MNERIKELEKKCWDHQINHLNSEKFAELIVKECIHTLQLKIVRNGNTPENERSREHIRDLAEHFGVQL